MILEIIIELDGELYKQNYNCGDFPIPGYVVELPEKLIEEANRSDYVISTGELVSEETYNKLLVVIHRSPLKKETFLKK